MSTVVCDHCGTEVRGDFCGCGFCALDDTQRGVLRVFLAARGNTKELERHLGVSYPTARARLDDLLHALGIDGSPTRREVLDSVSHGEVDVDSALDQLPRRARR